MFDVAADGPLYRATETLRVFAERRPSVRRLLANRRQRFERVHAVLPSTVRTGEAVDLLARAWDQCERPYDLDASFRVSTTDDEAATPDCVRFDGTAVTTATGVRFGTPGVQYLTLERVGTGERFRSNPVRVHDTTPEYRTYWGDLHLHSRYSDGVGSVESGLRFGRDVAGLDVVAYTDHDTMGFFIPPRLQRRRMRRRYFDATRRTVEAANDPGEFVTLFGYEWTKQPNRGGHVNVYFEDPADAALFDSIDPATDTYEELWARLREWRADHDSRVVTVPHHPAEAMYPFDFSAVEYDDDLAPLVEVYSQWGSSERPGSAGNRYPLAMGQGEVDEPGHYVADALAMGHRVGMLASSDYHGPHPGHSLIHADPHLPSLREWRDGGLGWGTIWRVWNEQSYPGGLCAFRATDLTREAVFDALTERRVYGTTQPHRPLVDLRVDGARVGSTVTADGARTVAAAVAGTGPIERVTVVRNGEAWRDHEGTTDADAGLDAYVVERSWVDDDPVTGVSWDDSRGSEADHYYLRVHQAGGGSAWAGPVWVEPEG